MPTKEEKTQAALALVLLKRLMDEVCEKPNAVHEALENCRYALEDINSPEEK